MQRPPRGACGPRALAGGRRRAAQGAGGGQGRHGAGNSKQGLLRIDCQRGRARGEVCSGAQAPRRCAAAARAAVCWRPRRPCCASPALAQPATSCTRLLTARVHMRLTAAATGQDHRHLHISKLQALQAVRPHAARRFSPRRSPRASKAQPKSSSYQGSNSRRLGGACKRARRKQQQQAASTPALTWSDCARAPLCRDDAKRG